MKRSKKFLYLAITGFLTSTALTGFYWQGTKYLKATKRWQLINTQMATETPTDLKLLQSTAQDKAYPFKYVGSDRAVIDQSNYSLVSRPRDSRMGFLIMKKIVFKNQGTHGDQDAGSMVCLDGWIPDTLKDKPQSFATEPRGWRKIRGILRKAEAQDYTNKKLPKQAVQKSGTKSYIDLPTLNKQLYITETLLSKQYYLEILEQEGADNSRVYPVRYTKSDFQLPYLTPAKHRDYATFWGTTSLVGLFAIIKVLRM